MLLMVVTTELFQLFQAAWVWGVIGLYLVHLHKTIEVANGGGGMSDGEKRKKQMTMLIIKIFAGDDEVMRWYLDYDDDD